MAIDFLFGVQDCKIAPWTSTGVYGTALDVVAISQLQVELQTTNAELNGDDETVAVHAKGRVANVQIQFAFRDIEVYECLTGLSSSIYGTATDALAIGADNYPYFGLCAKIDEVNAVGCRHIFVPKCKLMEGLSLSTQYGQFMTPQLNIRGVSDGNTFKQTMILNYATLKAVTLPPS